MDCVFCKIIKGEIPSKKVYEDELIYAFYDIPRVAAHPRLLVDRRGAQEGVVPVVGVRLHRERMRREGDEVQAKTATQVTFEPVHPKGWDPFAF